ncbi:hypothetical protein OMP38_25010 [Cohnella ginsengisoli]|uniref:Uncharacterized protein n=1 Tax=Cohnella ginsengisoli TaxID=425004 RepID=A0A9X4KQC7_9BACL|nr:hypothetical protein [Cohnella ginsengisoli]MDG0793725.1 hypothetical protein [Cohnella ginsengisoli]
MAELKADHPQNIRVKRRGRFRYVWAGALALFSIVALGVYYGYASDERLPSFHLETVEGDPSFGWEIQLDGSYIGRRGNRSMKVDAEGTRYSDANRVGRLFIWPFSKTYNASMEALIQAHREFMRGKEYGTLEQNDDKLIYAELVRKEGQATLKLSALNKKNREIGKLFPAGRVLEAAGAGLCCRYADRRRTCAFSDHTLYFNAL